MVIQKLTQVLSYLRSDSNKKKKKEKGEKDIKEEPQVLDKAAASMRFLIIVCLFRSLFHFMLYSSIFDEAGEYTPAAASHSHGRSERDSKREKRGSYFDKLVEEVRRAKENFYG